MDYDLLDDDDEDDDWEDDDQYGLGSSSSLAAAAEFGLGSSKEALMAYADAGSEAVSRRGPDLETRGYLLEFFAAARRGQFVGWEQILGALKSEEREILAAAEKMGASES